MDDWMFQFEGASDALLGALALPLAVVLTGAALRRWRTVARVSVTAAAGTAAGLAAAARRRDAVGAAVLLAAWLLLGGRLGWGAAAFVLLLAAACLRWRPVESGAVPRGAGRRLILLRIAALMLLCLPMLRPVWTRTLTERPRPRVAVLIDQSRSLLQRDPDPRAPDGVCRRVNAVRDAIGSCAPERRRLAETADIALIGFDARRAALADWGVSPDGDATDLAGALNSADAPDAPPSAVVLISDGADNVSGEEAARAAARRLAELGVAVMAVGVGSGAPIGDAPTVTAARIRAPRRVLVGSPAEIESEATAVDCAGRELRVELLWNDEVIAHRDWTPQSPRESIALSGRHTPRIAGFDRITIRAAARDARGRRDGGPSAERSQFVHVEAGGVAVLLVESHPRHETVFLRRALASDPRFRVESAYLARPAEGKWGNPLPRTVDDWARYRLVIMGDVPRRELLREQAESLLEAVAERGVGLIALGGLRRMELLRTDPLRDAAPTTFDDRAADWRDVAVTATAALLQRLGRSADAGAEAGGGLRDEPRGVAGGPAGARASAPAGLGDWRDLPIMPTANRLGTLKPTAEAWMTDAEGRAMAASIRAGAGRTVAIAFDGAWRWAMESDRGAELHRRFWRQLAMLAADLRPDAYIRTDEPRYVLQSIRGGLRSIAVEARVVDPLGGAAEEWSITAWCEGPLADGTDSATATQPRAAPDQPSRVPVVLNPSGELWTGGLNVTRPGEYRLVLEAAPGGTAAAAPTASGAADGSKRGTDSTPVRAENRFIVVEGDPERDQPAADIALMRELAAATAEVGGRYYPIERLGACLQQLQQLDRRTVRSIEQRSDPTAELRVPLLAALVVLLAIEWIIRRRRGFI